MANPHPAKMRPISARQFAQTQTPVSHRLAGVEEFQPATSRVPRASGELTFGSTLFNFYNADIAKEKDSPNAFSKKTAGTVYEGRNF